MFEALHLTFTSIDGPQNVELHYLVYAVMLDIQPRVIRK
jgi:hypothetical protein